MPGAAHPYSRDSNDSWLDELVGDIITPAKRTPSRRDDRNWENSPFGTPDSLAFHAAWVNPRSVLDWPALYHPRSTQQLSPTRSAGLKGYQTQLSQSRLSLRLGDERINASQPSTPSKQASKWSFDDVRSIYSAVSPCQVQPRSSSLDFAQKTPKKDPNPHRSPILAPLQLEVTESAPEKQATSLQNIPEEATPSNTSPASSTDSKTSSQAKRSTWSAFPRTSVTEVVNKTSPASDKTVLHTPRTQGEKNVFNAQDLQSRRPSSKSPDFESAMFKPHPAVRLFSDWMKNSHDARPSDTRADRTASAQLSILVGVCVSIFMVALDRNMITTAIPRITASFQSYDDIGWYGSAYLVASVSAHPLYGRLYPLFDIRWTFLVTIGIFELGSLISAVSLTSGVLILGRALQGFGSAGILTGAYIVGTGAVSRQRQTFLTALLGILFGLGALIGPLLGGAFADLVTWRWIFWMNLLMGGVTFATVFLPLRSQPVRDRRTSSWTSNILACDPIGNVILLGGCVSLFLALQLTEMSSDWKSSRCIGLLCGFSVAALGFICWTVHRGDTALVPLRLLRQRDFAASCGSAFFVYGAVVVHSYFLPIWFQCVRGDSATLSGVHMVPYMFAYALTSAAFSILMFKHLSFAPLAIVGAAVGTAGASLLTLLNQKSSTGTLIGFEIVASAGLGVVLQQSLYVVQTALKTEDVMIGTAVVFGCQSLGGAVFVSVGNAILRNSLFEHLNDLMMADIDIKSLLSTGVTAFRSSVPTEDLPVLMNLYNESFRKVFISAAVLCCCAFFCSLWLGWRRLEGRSSSSEEQENRSKA